MLKYAEMSFEELWHFFFQQFNYELPDLITLELLSYVIFKVDAEKYAL